MALPVSWKPLVKSKDSTATTTTRTIRAGFEVDGSAGEHDEGERGLGAVESVGAVEEEADFVVEAFVPAVGHPAAGGGVDAVAVLAYRARGLDELGGATALRAGAPAVQEVADGVGVEVAGEHRAQGLLELVGAPENSAGSLHLPQCLGLCLGEITQVFQQCPAGALEGLGDALIGHLASGLSDLAAQRLERVGSQLDDMEGIEADHRAQRAFAHGLGVGGSQVHRPASIRSAAPSGRSVKNFYRVAVSLPGEPNTIVEVS
jgi:hypothetical protein